MRLAMSILVRDELDVIESNVRFHAALGVSRFVITDNGSVDGTRERLEALADEFDIELIDEPGRTIDQDLWVTRMAERVRARGDVDWLIHNDADEFWCPVEGPAGEAPAASLVEAFAADLDERGGDRIGVLDVPRHNMVATRERAIDPAARFAAAQHRVRTTLELAPDASRWHDNGAHILIRTLPGKVVTRLDGLGAVAMGNHGAEHALGTAAAARVSIYHYPVRGYAQFETKVRNYGESLAANDRFGPRVSRHLRHWYERLLAGELEREFLDMHPDASRMAAHEAAGCVVRDGRLIDRLPLDRSS